MVITIAFVQRTIHFNSHYFGSLKIIYDARLENRTAYGNRVQPKPCEH